MLRVAQETKKEKKREGDKEGERKKGVTQYGV